MKKKNKKKSLIQPFVAAHSTFTLTEEQQLKLSKWLKSLGDIEQGSPIGGDIKYIFTPTSIGTALKVNVLEHEIDLSDYEDW